MDFNTLTHRKVRNAAKNIDKRSGSIDKGLNQARHLGLRDISAISVLRDLPKIYKLADDNNDEDLLKDLLKTISFSGKKSLIQWTTEEGRARVRAVQLFRALEGVEGDGAYDVLKGNIRTLPTSGSELRAMARDENLLQSLDKTKYIDEHKFLTTVDNSDHQINELQREWYLDQASLMEAYRSLEGKDASTQSLLVLIMLQSYAKATTIYEDEAERLGYQVNPIFSSTLTQVGAEYHRSTANKLLQKCAEKLHPIINLNPYQFHFIHNKTYSEVIARALSFGRVNLAVDSEDAFNLAADAVLEAFHGGTHANHHFAFDISDFFSTPKEALENSADTATRLQTLFLAAIKKYLLAQKENIPLIVPSEVESEEDQELALSEVLQGLGKLCHNALVVSIARYDPNEPSVEEDVEVALDEAEEAPPLDGGVALCPLLPKANTVTPCLEIVGPLPAPVNSNVKQPIDLLLFPYFFSKIPKEDITALLKEVYLDYDDILKNPQYEKALDSFFRDIPSTGYSAGVQAELEHGIIHTGYRPDPLQTKSIWQKTFGFERILGAAGIKISKFATPGDTPEVAKSLEDFLVSSTDVESVKISDQTRFTARLKKTITKFGDLSNAEDAAPYLKVFPAATVALLKGLLDFEFDETINIKGWIQESEAESPYDKTGAFSATNGQKLYTDPKCETETTAPYDAATLGREVQIYLQDNTEREAEAPITVTLTLEESENEQITVRDPVELELFADDNLGGSGVDKAFRARGLTDLLQTSYYRILNAMAEATNNKDDQMKVINATELIQQQIAMILILLEPYSHEDFAIAIKNALRDGEGGPIVPLDLGEPAIHLRPSAMHCLASVVAGVEALKGNNRLKVAFLKDCYYEEGFAIDEWRTYSRIGLDGDAMTLAGLDLTDGDTTADHLSLANKAPLDIYVCDFHHNISIERCEYKVEDVIRQVDLLYARDLVADKFTVAIDCTIDLICTVEGKNFLTHFSDKILAGELNVVLFRSGQKFDMLGMDNFYGGYSISVNTAAFGRFRTRMNDEIDELAGANRQGHTHLAKYAASYQELYRKLLMANTKRLYDGLPANAIYGSENPGPMQISKSTDPCNVFLDVKFPFTNIGNEDLSTVEKSIKDKVKAKLVEFTQAKKLPFSMRASFGFATTNYSTIFGTKVRVNPGLESAANNTAWINFFKGLHEHLVSIVGTDERDGSAYGQKIADGISSFEF